MFSRRYVSWGDKTEILRIICLIRYFYNVIITIKEATRSLSYSRKVIRAWRLFTLSSLFFQFERKPLIFSSAQEKSLYTFLGWTLSITLSTILLYRSSSSFWSFTLKVIIQERSLSREKLLDVSLLLHQKSISLLSIWIIFFVSFKWIYQYKNNISPLLFVKEKTKESFCFENYISSL